MAYVSPKDNLLLSCHRIASLLKRWLMGTHQGAVSHGHLDYYLDEFTFRFNRRTSNHRGKVFFRLLRYDVPYGRGAPHFLIFAARAGDRDASSLDVNAVYCASEPGSNDRDNLEEMQVFLYHLSFLVLSVNSL